MKKILTLTSIASIGAVLALLVACQTTASQAVVQKEALLSQSGFKVVTVDTPKQQQTVNGLPQTCSAVKYQGNLYYVFPTAKKDRIYVGKQAQYNAYKQALKAKHTQPKGAAGQLQCSATGANAARTNPAWSGETAGPHHIGVEEFQGSGPMMLEGE